MQYNIVLTRSIFSSITSSILLTISTMLNHFNVLRRNMHILKVHRSILSMKFEWVTNTLHFDFQCKTVHYYVKQQLNLLWFAKDALTVWNEDSCDFCVLTILLKWRIIIENKAFSFCSKMCLFPILSLMYIFYSQSTKRNSSCNHGNKQ